MRKPSLSIGQSLKAQKLPGRAPEEIRVDEMRGVRSPSMIVPGLGDVEAPCGLHEENSANVFGEIVGERFGGGTSRALRRKRI